VSIPPATTPDPDLDLDDEFAYKRSPVQRLQIFLHRYPWMSSLVVLIGVILVFALVNERFLLPGDCFPDAPTDGHRGNFGDCSNADHFDSRN